MRKPKLHPEALAYLERSGLEGVRSYVRMQTLDPKAIMVSGSELHPFRPDITRADVDQWVTWKAGQDARTLKVAMWASVIAAIASIIAVVVGVLAWLEPVAGPPGH